MNASTADYFEINLGECDWDDDTKTELSYLHCPEYPYNQPYDGPEISSCIIDGNSGASLSDISIYATDGIPKGVYITDDVTVSNVNIYCDRVDSLNGYQSGTSTSPFSQTSDCWWTRNPTSSATTISPTPSPANVPTPSPTNNPTPSPTINPIAATTTNAFTPTPIPSPTNILSASLTNNPTHATSRSAEAETISITTKSITTTLDQMNGASNGGETASNNYIEILIVTILSFIALMCCCLAYYYRYQSQKKDTNTKEQTGHHHIAASPSSVRSEFNVNENMIIPMVGIPNNIQPAMLEGNSEELYGMPKNVPSGENTVSNGRDNDRNVVNTRDGDIHTIPNTTPYKARNNFKASIFSQKYTMEGVDDAGS